MPKKNPLVEILERISWTMQDEQKEGITILITHRGARNDTKELAIQDVAGFDHGYLHVRVKEGEEKPEYGDEILIPFHRVMQVVDSRTGTVLYEKK